MTELRSKKIILLPLAQSDQALWIQLHQSPEVMEHIEQPLSEETARRRFGTVMANSNRHFAFRIFDQGSDTSVGVTALIRACHESVDWEVGTLLLHEFQNSDYATLAMVLLFDKGFAKLPLKKVTASHKAQHVAAGKLVERLSFHRDKVFLEPSEETLWWHWSLTEKQWYDGRETIINKYFT